MNDELSTKDLAKLLAPFLAMTALAAVFVVLILLRFLPNMAVAPSVVSFDVVKYTNSQRAVASSFLKPGADVAQVNELLLNLPQRTRTAIEDVAGPGTLVVIKQAVVQGQTEDITDAVLKKLSMPTNVPTADGPALAIDMAPTMLSGLPSAGSVAQQPVVGSDNKQVLP